MIVFHFQLLFSVQHLLFFFEIVPLAFREIFSKYAWSFLPQMNGLPAKLMTYCLLWSISASGGEQIFPTLVPSLESHNCHSLWLYPLISTVGNKSPCAQTFLLVSSSGYWKRQWHTFHIYAFLTIFFLSVNLKQNNLIIWI